LDEAGKRGLEPLCRNRLRGFLTPGYEVESIMTPEALAQISGLAWGQKLATELRGLSCGE